MKWVEVKDRKKKKSVRKRGREENIPREGRYKTEIGRRDRKRQEVMGRERARE